MTVVQFAERQYDVTRVSVPRLAIGYAPLKIPPDLSVKAKEPESDTVLPNDFICCLTGV